MIEKNAKQTHQSEFIQRAIERGYHYQSTDIETLDALMARESIVAYLGFDCTATSLHIGSLMQIMILRLLQQTGHQPVVLLGGGTTRVGDPSGKDESRKMLTDEDIARNKAGIQKIFEIYLDFDPKTPNHAILVDNADWLDQLGYIEFLRDIGPHFSINRMLHFDSVKTRLEREQNLTFLEFNYMLLQAYDFVELSERHQCRLQIGGSDQWGNIVSGVELGRRLKTKELYGFTTPLMTTSSGAKMGKTAQGAVWLDADLCAPYEFWQFWRNVEDADVGRFLRIYTELPIKEIERLEALQGAEINEAKKILASEVTAMCHGKVAADEALMTARTTFEEGQIGDALPTFEIELERLKEGVPAFQLLQEAGLCASNSEARKLIRGRGARVNDRLLEDELHQVALSDITAECVIKLSAGKKRHVIVKPLS